MNALSRTLGRRVTLGSVPDNQWDALHALGIDLVYLMGVWRRSALGRHLARSEVGLFPAFDRAVPGWRAKDVVGSAFSVAAYEPDSEIGTWDDVDAVREKLHARSMALIVDFIVNHTGFDHAWIADHPDRYVNVPEETFRRDPGAFRIVETPSGDVRFIACGRDPFFPPWTDVAQIDHFSPDARAAMIGELRAIARHADGARCDMAMLALSDVFARTWGAHVDAPPPGTEFWADARAAVPGFTLVAEVYWDLERRLQQLGLDFTYDKGLYDLLLRGNVLEVRAHLAGDDEYQRRTARFIENHDEDRSAAAFGDRVRPAAVAMSTIQGLRFFHDGQFEGRRARLPVQLGVMAEQTRDEHLLAFYSRLLSIVGDEQFHRGEWRLLDVASAGDDTHEQLVAWRWKRRGALHVVAVNLGRGPAQAHVLLNEDLPAGVAAFIFEDLLNDRVYPWSRAALESAGGLYVRLDKGASHIFEVIGRE